MRLLLLLLLVCFSLASRADDYQRLFESAGWPQQRSHFSQALGAAQQRYQATLPPAVFQALVDNSNRRFEPRAMEQRAQAALRMELADPVPALQFFDSTIGRKVVSAEVRASSPQQLQANADGLPASEVSATRRLQIRHLAQALPASAAGAEVSLALAGVAADSLSSMVPGLFGGDQLQILAQSQRQQLLDRLNGQIDDTLLYVYRDLSEAELEEFTQFAESSAGQDYYQAALAAMRAALAVGQASDSLDPAVQGI